MKRARLLIVDDHSLLREGLVSLINAQPDMAVVGQAEDGLEALTLARNLRPDLIVMDINMPISDGLEATHLIRAEIPDTAILILTVEEDDANLFEAIKDGAIGYVTKNITADGLLAGLRGALAVEAVLPPKLAKRVLAEFASMASQQPAREEPFSQLTLRERVVLEYLVVGASNKEISEGLSISLYTTKSHVRSILSKLQVASRLEAARIALKQGLVRGDPHDQDRR